MTEHAQIKLFQFPRMFGIPNLSPFCCKMETWLRIAQIPYEVVVTPDPRKGPHGKLPFIEDGDLRIDDTTRIVHHLVKTRGVDPDASLDASQRALALLVQRTVEDHYAFIVAYTHLYWEDGIKYTRGRFDRVPAIVRPMVARAVRGQVKEILWRQGTLRYPHDEIMEAGIRDWRALLTVMGERPFFFGHEPTGVDAILFGALATTVLTPIESPIRDFLRSQPACLAYVERMRERLYADLPMPSLGKTGVPSTKPPRVMQAGV